ncbi:MAG: hypothetical protein DMG69_03530 [Acidobacteria bacterium]|nr:MAG: hypothetical protein DMG69_03530 [Acidobacteriota bacterium]
MIAEPSAILTVGDVDLAFGSVHCPRFRRTQFGAVAIAYPVSAVAEVALVLRDGHFTGFGLA